MQAAGEGAVGGEGGDKDRAGYGEGRIQLVMVEGCYDERSSKTHVRRLRELIKAPDITPASAAFALLPVVDSDGKVDAASLADDAKTVLPDEQAADPCRQQLDPSSLLPLFDIDWGGTDVSYKEPHCLKSMALSPLNPPPPHRRLHGDLAYYDVVLSDDRRLCVTAGVRGFFVNRSADVDGSFVLDGAPSDATPQIAYTLVGLLSIVSPAFKRNWAKVVQAQMGRDPLESVPSHLSVSTWAALHTPHTADASRIEDSMAVCYGVETGAPARDWNEEIQNCKELAGPSSSRRERLLRERTAFKVSSDFVEAATKGAVAIVDRCIPPINPMDLPSAQMYVFNSIFFSYAVPAKEAAGGGVGSGGGEAGRVAEGGEGSGGGGGGARAGSDDLADQPSYASSNQDLNGVRLMSATDTEGLYTLATAVVDYRGFRVVAQSIIPGILQVLLLNCVCACVCARARACVRACEWVCMTGVIIPGFRRRSS